VPGMWNTTEQKLVEKLTVLAVIRATACPIPLFRQFSSSTTPFPFYYTPSVVLYIIFISIHHIIW